MIQPILEMSDLDSLMSSFAQDPVLYLDANCQISVWAAAYVPHGRVLLTRGQVVDLAGFSADQDTASLWASLGEARQDIFEQVKGEIAEDVERILSDEQ